MNLLKNFCVILWDSGFSAHLRHRRPNRESIDQRARVSNRSNRSAAFRRADRLRAHGCRGQGRAPVGRFAAKRQRMRGNKAALAHFTQLQTRTQNVQPFERGQLRRRPEPRVSKGDSEAIGQFYMISFQKFADGYGQLLSGLDGLNFTCAVAAAFQ